MILSPEEFVRLRRSESPADYRRAAEEEAPLEVWLSVIDQFPDMREWVAHNKTVPLGVLERLASDSNAAVRATVASKRKLSEGLQALLCADLDASVRERLACNANVNESVLRLLAEDAEEFVRSAATKRLCGRQNAL